MESLTAREREVLALLADGVGNREIAHALGISEHTVKFHLGAIFGKLGATTRTEAVRRGAAPRADSTSEAGLGLGLGGHDA